MAFGAESSNEIQSVVNNYTTMMIIVCAVGVATKHITKLPYTIALTIVGLILGLFKVGPDIAGTGFGKELVLFVLLPPLLFQGALHLQLDRLKKHIIPVMAFATVGVLISTLIIGFLMYQFSVFDSLLIAMLFGALICTTDPVSVLAIFKMFKTMPTDLKYLVEGESLFNDGTGVVVFFIVLELIATGNSFELMPAITQFLKVALGGTLIGVGTGFIVYHILKHLNDRLLENTICLVACYGSFCFAESMHLSGVIAVVCCGLLIGNYGRQFAMNSSTNRTVVNFFESIDFIINSMLFILIGLELRAIPLSDILNHLGGILIGIIVVLFGRAAVVYPLFFATRNIGMERPAAWAHILFWGGLRGSIPIALLLGLPNTIEALTPYRSTLLVIGFGVVCFSLIGQGLTMKPLIQALKISDAGEEDEDDPGHDKVGIATD